MSENENTTPTPANEKAKERLQAATCSPCPKCGNDFIELFSGHSGWWVGCKPCSKVDGGPEHFLAESRDAAIQKWNAYADPDQENAEPIRSDGSATSPEGKPS